MRVSVLVSALLVAMCCPPPACAQTGGPYTLVSFSIDGGGGVGTGGVFSLRGALGQPDAGRLSGGEYTLEGGFLSVALVHTPGAPKLSISRASPGLLTISWSSPAPGYVLQVRTSLTAGDWADVSGAPSNPAFVPANGEQRFYRLRKP